MKIAKWMTIIIFICSIAVWIYGKKEMKKQDIVAPVITSTIDELYVDVTTGEEGLKDGLTAFDDEDGDITENIIVGTISPFKKKGVSDVKYIARSWCRKYFDKNMEQSCFGREQSKM